MEAGPLTQTCKRLACGQWYGHLGRVAPSEALCVNSQLGSLSKSFLKQNKKKKHCKVAPGADG